MEWMPRLGLARIRKEVKRGTEERSCAAPRQVGGDMRLVLVVSGVSTDDDLFKVALGKLKPTRASKQPLLAYRRARAPFAPAASHRMVLTRLELTSAPLLLLLQPLATTLALGTAVRNEREAGVEWLRKRWWLEAALDALNGVALDALLSVDEDITSAPKLRKPALGQYLCVRHAPDLRVGGV
mmetsp:Transcript_10657/g.33882  ORF Transcript_10657/g.33882 Transcript_10657/m.33882 type:complete len:183 (+) Transcript_10657:127-675(+)